MFRKGLGLKIRSVFLDSKGNLVVFDVNGNNGGTVRLVSLNAMTDAGPPESFKCLVAFVGAS